MGSSLGGRPPAGSCVARRGGPEGVRVEGMDRTGSALMPLHSGKVPDWLHARMARLGRVLVEATVLYYGRPG